MWLAVAAALISAHLASETRTDCTQAISSVPRPSAARRWMPPTVPPGFLGVLMGVPTVPNNNPGLAIGLVLLALAGLGLQLRQRAAQAVPGGAHLLHLLGRYGVRAVAALDK